MAYHYEEVGFTKAVIGAEYVRFLKYCAARDRCKLRSFNAATGIATMVREGGRVFYVSLTVLSRWHLVSAD